MEFRPLSAHLLVARSATPYHDAVADRAVRDLAELTQAGIDLDDGSGPDLLARAIEAELDEARRTGEEAHVDLTALLLAAGADPHRPADGVTALQRATERGHWLAALLIGRWGRAPLADPDPLPPQPDESMGELNSAIEVERFRDAYEMLAAGADVHAEMGGSSLLVQALYVEEDGYAQSREMHLDGSALLLAMGADPWRAPRGRTAPTAAQIADHRYPPVALLYRSWRRHGRRRA